MRLVAMLTAALMLTATLCGCAGTSSGSDVTILVTWAPGTPQRAAFDQVINTFKSEYKLNVKVESTRALDQELDADLSQGNAPDVAALPSIGEITQWEKYLKPLNGLVKSQDFGAPWSGLMRPFGGSRIYDVPVRADVKSLVWYNPAKLAAAGRPVPSTWARLVGFGAQGQAAGTAPWCLTVQSPPSSGWPGADWIADILLHMYGPATYREWVSGTLSWTSTPVTRAWQTWNQLIADGANLLDTASGALSGGVGTVNPATSGCYLAHGTLVDQGMPAKGFGTSYAFFPFPDAPGETTNAIEVSADFLGLFNDTPAARELVTYLASPAAQRALVGYKKGADGFSASNKVPVTAYKTTATRQIAALLLTGGRELCFGAADAMAPDLSAAFYDAVLEDLADPGALATRILPELNQIATSGAHSAPGVASNVCGAS
jgi:alpha-glucoside transport system substrate-binding protein